MQGGECEELSSGFGDLSAIERELLGHSADCIQFMGQYASNLLTWQILLRSLVVFLEIFQKPQYKRVVT